MRILGFDSRICGKLADFEESRESLRLDNCEVKQSHLNSDLEILVSPRTNMEKSDREYVSDKSVLMEVEMGKCVL